MQSNQYLLSNAIISLQQKNRLIAHQEPNCMMQPTYSVRSAVTADM